jgi:hypothetical protein
MQSLRPASTSASVLHRSRTGESKSSVRNCLHSTGRAARTGSLCAPRLKARGIQVPPIYLEAARMDDRLLP